MSLSSDIEAIDNAKKPAILDFFRIALGLFITYKGVVFSINIDSLMTTTAGINMFFAGAALAHYVIFAHLLGGPLIALGLFTRVVCIIQIPVLIGAIIFVNYPKGFLSIGNHMELEISILVLSALILFTVLGAGSFSIDERRKKDPA